MESTITKKPPKYKVLVVDDEVAIRRLLQASLSDTEFDVLEAGTGKDGIQTVARSNPDVVILDLGLPDMDGIEVVHQVREWTNVPIIVLSARWQEDQKVKLLEAGVDDYVTKPFGVGELLARIRVSIRHRDNSQRAMQGATFESGDLKVDIAARQVWVSGKEVHLTPIEYKLLVTLINNAGKVVTHRQLLLEVWGAMYSEETQYLRVYMGYLRRKIETNPLSPKLLLTEPRVGYRLALEAPKADDLPADD